MGVNDIFDVFDIFFVIIDLFNAMLAAIFNLGEFINGDNPGGLF